jgi:hypothetical protein
MAQGAAECIDVGTRVQVPLAERLLRAHEVRRPERHLGDACTPFRPVRSERNAEVGDQCTAVMQQDVLGLDVAMDRALVGVHSRAHSPPPAAWDSVELAERKILLDMWVLDLVVVVEPIAGKKKAKQKTAYVTPRSAPDLPRELDLSMKRARASSSSSRTQESWDCPNN